MILKLLSIIAMCLLLTLGLRIGVFAQNDRAVAPSTQKVQLEPCRLPGWKEDARCGKYEVYEDRQARTGRKIALKIIVAPALKEIATPDPIFYFTGGPGGSSTETITRAGSGFLALLRRDHDLVFVDQRGTGESNPLACNLYPDKNDMAAYFNEVISIDRLRACRAELEKIADLKLYSTATAMDDLDEVRAALGYEKINLFGGSYGSTAALAYLRQYPQRVRTATILGVAPPDMKLPLPVIKGVQSAVDHVFADCAADEKCRSDFPNLKDDLDTAIKRLEKEPARFVTVNPFTQKPHQITLTRPVFGEYVRTMLYQPEFSRWLPLLLHQAAAGEFGLFASVAFQSFRGIEDQIARGMHFSVVCAEDVPFITDADVAREKNGSFYGDHRVQAYRKVCEFWPRANVPASFARPVVSDAPVLLISGEADPVAPPWLAAAAATKLPNGRHFTVPHTGHAFNFPCVDNLIAEFVSKGSAKELDLSCVSQIRRPPFITEAMLAAFAKSQTASGDKPAATNELIWQGTLDVGAAKFHLALRLAKGANGEWTGKLDSPDQNSNNLPIDAITWKDQSFRFEMGMIGAVYEGRVTADGAEITGEWRQQGRNWPLIFKRASAAK